MSYCPSENNSGFVQWSGEITNEIFKSIVVDGSPTFHLSIAATTIPAKLVDANHISDTVGHTCSYLGAVYNITDIQICKPVHFVNKGYRMPLQDTPENAIAELIICFVASSHYKGQPGVSDGILLCMPIYKGNTYSENAGYIKQLVESHADVASVKTLESLFSGPSFGCFHYHTCFETKTGGNKSLLVFAFPKGVQITFTIGADGLPLFTLPVSIRDGHDTLSGYNLNQDGVKENLIWSSSGNLYMTEIDVRSADFKGRFPYYRRSPILPSTSGKVDTFLQRCVPFTDSPNTGDFKNSHVMPGTTTMQKVLEERYTLEEEQKKVVTVKEGLSTGTIEGIIAGLILFFMFIAIFFAGSAYIRDNMIALTTILVAASLIIGMFIGIPYLITGKY